MRTKKAADEFFFNVTASTGFVQNVAFQDGLHMEGGGTDWLGVDDGWRDKSPELQAATANNQELRKYSPFSDVGIPQEQLDEVGRSFNNQYTPEVKELPPNASFTVSSGNYFDIADTGAKSKLSSHQLITQTAGTLILSREIAGFPEQKA